MSSKRLLLPAIAALLVVLTGGCKKDLNEPNAMSSRNSSNTSSSTLGTPQAGVNLGLAGNFAILSKSGITDVPSSSITGDIGTSPITGAAITGITCPEVIGTIYTVNDAGPACKVINPTMLTTAVLDMQAAYTDAAGRINPDFTELGAGIIGGLTLTPGLYKWTSTVSIPTDVTISGGPDDVWIFQIAGTLTMSSAVKVILSGGAQAKNIYWATAGATTFGTTSHFEGIILAQTNIAMQTGATINGRMLAQTAVTLQMNTVTQPSTVTSPPPPQPPVVGGTPQAGVNLGLAGNFAILSKSGITDVSPSSITGNIGTSPITGAAITGVTCPEVIGSIYTVNDAGPSCKLINPSMLTTAVLDMQAAYTDAAGRINPDFTELGAGNIGGLTLTPGLYKWTSTVSIPTNVTISGGPDDVWIFQIAGTVTMASAVRITLSGGAQAKNIYWAIAGATTFGTTSHFEGIILAQTNIAMQTGATMNGKLLAQTAVTLQMNTVN
jgi:Ice-binding-like